MFCKVKTKGKITPKTKGADKRQQPTLFGITNNTKNKKKEKCNSPTL